MILFMIVIGILLFVGISFVLVSVLACLEGDMFLEGVILSLLVLALIILYFILGLMERGII